MQVAAGKLEQVRCWWGRLLCEDHARLISVLQQSIFITWKSQSPVQIFGPASLSAFVRETLSEAGFLFVIGWNTSGFSRHKPQREKFPHNKRDQAIFLLSLWDETYSSGTCLFFCIHAGFTETKCCFKRQHDVFDVTEWAIKLCGCSWVWLKFPRVEAPIWALLHTD